MDMHKKYFMSNTSKLARRRFLSLAGSLGLGSLSAPLRSVAATSPDPVESAILKAGPYLQSPFGNSIIIRWLTQVPCYSWVEYGETATQLDRKALHTQHGMVVSNNTLHAVKLQALQPGKTYYYRICSKTFAGFEPYKITYGNTYTSPVYHFRTVPEQSDSVSFLVLNDIHDRPESFGKLLPYAGSEQRDFVFLNGDMFNYQTDENQLVNHLLQPLGEQFATHTPLLFSRGNHETRGKFSQHLCDYFDGGEEKFYFSFQCGPVACIVLDSGEDKEDSAPVYAGIAAFDEYRRQQAAWLAKEVEKKSFRRAKYKIVFSHIPLYHSGDWHGTLHCREVWGPILNKAGIDLLISGHTHVYGIHQPEKDTHHYPIVIGGGPADGKRTLITVKADHHSLELNMLNDAGVSVGKLNL
jgi:predicted phosphodiesterase